ncbi:FlgB family protein [Thalassococcus lentus]|uniref:FlgB family protein n=1 Tax=Thalassococcus lentus TaxID=1210524 RepID=A0ABT4XN01_9RHOB|nr:FlgB family protein [Thalassococcus lentus]MDA7423323.1 FlgB family protein [Thalassococcus lentus]
MFQNLDVFKTAMAMARHAGHMQALSAQNIANADTPGFRAKQIQPFAQSLQKTEQTLQARRPGHLQGAVDQNVRQVSDRAAQDPNGNSVSLELEMINAVEAKRQHDRALAIYRNSLSILRSSLGRN